jgi:5-methylcytosine-specific restriction enzyme A
MVWRECPVNGCPELTKGGRCEKHSLKATKHTEPFYNTSRWQRTRAAYGQKNPLCERCLKMGIIKPKDMVHHIVPIADGGDETNSDNLESLCWKCHGEIDHSGGGGQI